MLRQLDLWTEVARMDRMPEGWLTTSEVAKQLGLKQQQVRDMIRAGKFPNAEQINSRTWLIPEGDLKGVQLPKMGRPKKRPGRPRKP